MKKEKAKVRFMEVCYGLYEQKMYRVANGILHDTHLAEDAVQEAFLNLMRHQVYFDDPESEDCKRYMITVIRNASINMYNKKAREQEWMYLSGEQENWQGDVLAALGSPGMDIDELTSGLSKSYKDVVDCLVLRGLSVRETAKALKISEANVRKRYERAKKRMKKNMQKGNEEDGAKRKVYRVVRS